MARTAPRTIAAALADSPAGPLLHTVAQTQRLTAVIGTAIASLTPDFDANEPGSCELKGSVLIVNAHSAAQAAKLRQGLPSLLAMLHQRGAQVSEVRVRVQPTRTPYPLQATGPQATGAPRERSEIEAALRFAQTLEATLPPGPLRQNASRMRSSLERRLKSGR